MQKSEVAKLLTFVGSVEGREAATKLQVDAWAELIGVVEYDDAMSAVREHYLNESRRLWPADVLNWRDAHEVRGEEVAEQSGLVISERRWSNAAVLPAEEVERLGAAHASGIGPEYERRLEILYGLTPRPKAVQA